MLSSNKIPCNTPIAQSVQKWNCPDGCWSGELRCLHLTTPLPMAQYPQWPPWTLSSGVLRNPQTPPAETNPALKIPRNLSWRRSPKEMEQEVLGGMLVAQVTQQCRLFWWESVTKRKGARSGNKAKCEASYQLPPHTWGRPWSRPACALVPWCSGHRRKSKEVSGTPLSPLLFLPPQHLSFLSSQGLLL